VQLLEEVCRTWPAKQEQGELEGLEVTPLPLEGADERMETEEEVLDLPGLQLKEDEDEDEDEVPGRANLHL